MAQLNYLLFHAIAEGFAIVVAALIYVLGTRTYRHSKNTMFLLLGIAYAHVAVLDFAHLLTYKGMGVFSQYGSDTPTQLWIAGRFMEAISFLIALYWQNKTINRRWTTLAYSLATACLLVSIMVWPVFPVCFVEGQGLTTFKIASEYVIMGLLLVGTYTIHAATEDNPMDKMSMSIKYAMLVTALSELTFTLYTDVYGVFNMLGHFLKIISYWIVFTGVLLYGIDKPYSIIADELKERATKDALTGLYNRLGLTEFIERESGSIKERKGNIGLLMIDFDNFKLINDNYGHLYGDQVLKEFVALLSSALRVEDVAGRFGGDEFVVLVRGLDLDGLERVKQRILAAADSWFSSNHKLKHLGISISIGVALALPADSWDFETLLLTADRSMYDDKRRKKSYSQGGISM